MSALDTMIACESVRDSLSHGDSTVRNRCTRNFSAFDLCSFISGWRRWRVRPTGWTVSRVAHGRQAALGDGSCARGRIC